VRHFDFLTVPERDRLFLLAPQPFSPASDPNLLAVALGATLYTPATRPVLAADLIKLAARGVMSMVVCLEDSIADEDLAAAEANAISQLRTCAASGAPTPLVFIRVRTPEQIPMIVEGLGDCGDVLCGFVLPKFTPENGAAYLDAVVKASAAAGHLLMAMPVLESPGIIHTESRIKVLLGISDLVSQYAEHVLAIRIGATDLCAAYGLRRPRELTVYDVKVVANLIADVVNVFARTDERGLVVSGPVWEYFPDSERIFKPQLRETPFIEHAERALRTQILAKDLDGLIREVVLDKANGLTGKTVIHPTHVAAVNAMMVVTHEEYSDSIAILGTKAVGGAMASTYRNKMNESKPHAAWAERTLQRAHVFGVANEGVSFVDLLGAGLIP
jgi:citrate lyase beta subunit